MRKILISLVCVGLVFVMGCMPSPWSTGALSTQRIQYGNEYAATISSGVASGDCVATIKLNEDKIIKAYIYLDVCQQLASDKLVEKRVINQ